MKFQFLTTQVMPSEIPEFDNPLDNFINFLFIMIIIVGIIRFVKMKKKGKKLKQNIVSFIGFVLAGILITFLGNHIFKWCFSSLYGIAKTDTFINNRYV